MLLWWCNLLCVIKLGEKTEICNLYYASGTHRHTVPFPGKSLSVLITDDGDHHHQSDLNWLLSPPPVIAQVMIGVAASDAAFSGHLPLSGNCRCRRALFTGTPHYHLTVEKEPLWLKFDFPTNAQTGQKQWKLNALLTVQKNRPKQKTAK